MKELKVKGFKRVNEALQPELLESSELSEMLNMVLDSPGDYGIPVKRGGWKEFNGNSVGSEIKFLFHAADEEDTEYLIAFAGGSLMKSLNGTGTWSVLKSGLSGSGRFTGAALGDGIYVFTNGVDPAVRISGAGFDDVSDLEIAAPDISGIRTAHQNGGSMTPGAVYYYIFTFTTELGEESQLSLPFTHHISTGNENSTDNDNRQIYLGGIPSSTDSRITSVNIYRTKGIRGLDEEEEMIFYYLDSISNTKGYYIDMLADTDLDSTQPVTFLNMPAAGYVLYHKSRLFLANLKFTEKTFYQPAHTRNFDGSPPGSWSDGAVFSATSDIEAPNGPDKGKMYKWRVTFVDDTGIESSPVDTPSYITSSDGLSDKVAVMLDNVPFIPDTVDNDYKVVTRKLYRTKADGSIFYHQGDSPVSSPGLTDTRNDSQLGDEYQPNGELSYPGGVIVSSIDRPATFPVENIIRVTPYDNQAVTGISDDSSGLLIFKERSISKIYTESSPENWRGVQISENLGCDQPATLVKFGSASYFVFKKALYRYSGSADKLSEFFINTLGSVDTFHDAAYYPDRNWLVTAAESGGMPSLLIYDEKTAAWYKFTVSPVNKAYSLASHNGSLFFGNSGRVYKYDETDKYDYDSGAGTGITCMLRTKTFTFGGGFVKARLRKIFVNYQSDDDSYSASGVEHVFADPDTGIEASMTEINNEIVEKTFSSVFQKLNKSDTLAAKIYYKLTGNGIRKFYSLRVLFREVNRGSNV